MTTAPRQARNNAPVAMTAAGMKMLLARTLPPPRRGRVMEKIARDAAAAVAELVGSIVLVFSRRRPSIMHGS
jgi:hypothetical protein